MVAFIETLVFIRLEELEEGGWLRPKLGQVVPVPKDKKDDTRYMVDGGIVTSRHEVTRWPGNYSPSPS